MEKFDKGKGKEINRGKRRTALQRMVEEAVRRKEEIEKQRLATQQDHKTTDDTATNSQATDTVKKMLEESNQSSISREKKIDEPPSSEMQSKEMAENSNKSPFKLSELKEYLSELQSINGELNKMSGEEIPPYKQERFFEIGNYLLAFESEKYDKTKQLKSKSGSLLHLGKRVASSGYNEQVNVGKDVRKLWKISSDIWLVYYKEQLKEDFEAITRKLKELSTAGKPSGFWNDTKNNLYKQVEQKVPALLASANIEDLSQIKNFTKQLDQLHILAQDKLQQDNIEYLGKNMQHLNPQDRVKYDNFTGLEDTDPLYKQKAQEIMELADIVRARKAASHLLGKMNVVTDLKALKEVLKGSDEFDEYLETFQDNRKRLESFIQNKDKSEPQGQELSRLVKASKDLSESFQNVFQNLNNQEQNWRKETKSIEQHINKYFQGIASADIDRCFFEAFRHCQQDFSRLLEKADITNKYKTAQDSSSDPQPVRKFIETFKNLAGSKAELARFESLREHIKVETAESWRKEDNEIKENIDKYLGEIPQGDSGDIDKRFLTQFRHCQQDFSRLLEEANQYKEVQLDFENNPDVRGSILQSFEDLVARKEELREFDNIRNVITAVRDTISSGSTHESMLAEKIQAGEMNDTLQIIGKLQSLRSFEYLTGKTKYVTNIPIGYWKVLMEVDGRRVLDTAKKAKKVPCEDTIKQFEEYTTLRDPFDKDSGWMTTDHKKHGSYDNKIDLDQKLITCISNTRKSGLYFSQILRHQIRLRLRDRDQTLNNMDTFPFERAKRLNVTNKRTKMALAICTATDDSIGLADAIFTSTYKKGERKIEIGLQEGIFRFTEGSQKHTVMESTPNIYGLLHLLWQDAPDLKITQIENTVKNSKNGSQLDIMLHFNKDNENLKQAKNSVEQLERLYILAETKESIEYLGNNMQHLNPQDQEKYDNFTQLPDTDPSYKQTAQEIMELADRVRARLAPKEGLKLPYPQWKNIEHENTYQASVDNMTPDTILQDIIGSRVQNEGTEENPLSIAQVKDAVKHLEERIKTYEEDYNNLKEKARWWIREEEKMSITGNPGDWHTENDMKFKIGNNGRIDLAPLYREIELRDLALSDAKYTLELLQILKLQMSSDVSEGVNSQLMEKVLDHCNLSVRGCYKKYAKGVYEDAKNFQRIKLAFEEFQEALRPFKEGENRSDAFLKQENYTTEQQPHINSALEKYKQLETTLEPFTPQKENIETLMMKTADEERLNFLINKGNSVNSTIQDIKVFITNELYGDGEFISEYVSNPFRNCELEIDSDISIKILDNFYKTLKYEKHDDKIDKLIELYPTKMHRILNNGIYNETTFKLNSYTEHKTYVYPEEQLIDVQKSFKSKEDAVYPSDIIALHYFFSVQQFYGIGESNGEPIKLITHLKEIDYREDPPDESRITLQEHEALALKASLSPLFSPSSPDAEGGKDQIHERFREIKHIKFSIVMEDTFIKIMDPYCPLDQKKTFFKGSHAYNEALTRTPFGKCVARIQQKYFSSSNITRVEIDRPNRTSNFGDVTFSFD